jgi:hypothetical protein
MFRGLRFTEADAEELKEFIGTATRNASYPIAYLNNPETATISIEIPRAGLKTTNDIIKDKAKELGWTVSERLAKDGFTSENNPGNIGAHFVNMDRHYALTGPIKHKQPLARSDKLLAQIVGKIRRSRTRDRTDFTPEEREAILHAEEELNKVSEASESEKS